MPYLIGYQFDTTTEKLGISCVSWVQLPQPLYLVVGQVKPSFLQNLTTPKGAGFRFTLNTSLQYFLR